MNASRRFLLCVAIMFPSAIFISAQESGTAQFPSSASALDQIAFVHGGTGPFAVAGYRIGERALRELKVPRGTFSLEVIHKTPNEVQWSCVADGVQAATGVSIGKLNLKLEIVSRDAVETIVRDRASGRTIVFRLKPEFANRYLDLPHEKLQAAGREVLSLPDDQIFSMEDAR
jgi:formylmethanofuran dehydrogenase subunit E